MAIQGWKNSSSRPEGRRGFAEAPNVLRREVVAPGTYGDVSRVTARLRDGRASAQVRRRMRTAQLTELAKVHSPIRA